MIKTGNELAEAARNVAEQYKTLYVLLRIILFWGLNEMEYLRIPPPRTHL